MMDKELIKKHSAFLPWWQRSVIYQIYPRSFKDTNGDGVGDLAGIIEKLDYLNDGTTNSLGIDAIWISPFYPSPNFDFGYDVSDYCAVDPMFGDLATFDRLLSEAHRRGIRVIIDYVPNHTSDQHPWFQEARSRRDHPRRDWYIWRDPRPDGSLPNNWGSYFGGPAWTFDPLTGQYYLHQFTPQQPELNWRNPAVREAMLEVLRFWLERGVDGFRMDVIGLIIKDADLRDNPPNPDADPNLPPEAIHHRQIHVYDLDQDEVHEIIYAMRKLLDSFGESSDDTQRIGIGEVWGEIPRWIRYYGERGDGLHLPFNFRLIELPWQASVMRRSVEEMEEALPSFAWPNYVLGNHDRPRLATRYGGQAQARLAAMMLLTLRGTPTLYYGDELGLENANIPPERIVDPQGINLGPSFTRDGCRTPMQWNDKVHAGFSSVEPWLPVFTDYASCNVAAQSKDPDSMLSFYRRLLWLRRESRALHGGSFLSLNSPSDCFVYLREVRNERRLIALNFSARSQMINLTAEVFLAGQETPRLLLSTHSVRDHGENLRRLSLHPYEGVMLAL